MVSQGNIEKIFEKIIEGSPPEKYNVEHLKGLGFKSSNDRAIIPLLKDLGFLTSDGSPTQVYNEYRNTTKSGEVLGRALLDTYSDIFSINENPTVSDRKSIEGKFKTVHGSNDKRAQLQATTFLSLLKRADLDAARSIDGNDTILQNTFADEIPRPASPNESETTSVRTIGAGLHYNIQIHLPATKDIEIYNSIFKSIRKNLLDG